MAQYASSCYYMLLNERPAVSTQVDMQELSLYASNMFMQDAYEAGFRQIGLDESNTYDIVRMARASETLPDLGGIALFGETEAANGPSVETAVATVKEDHVVGAALSRQAMLNRLEDGRPVEINPLPFCGWKISHRIDGSTR